MLPPSRVRTQVLLGCWALLGAAPRLAAQSPGQRDSIVAFRDSLAGVTDSVSLLALEKKLIAHASKEMRDSAMIHIRLGFIGIRLGDLGGADHYDAGASEFQWATTLQPTWPYGWFGLGLAELGVGDSHISFVRGLQTMLGKDALTRSADDFAKSAEVDPGFVQGLVELSNIALRQRLNARMDVALAALRRAAKTPAAQHPEVLLARARVEREAGSPDSALMVLGLLLKHDPNYAPGLLELARTRFLVNRIDGVLPWYRGLQLADNLTLTQYKLDLQPVMPDSTLTALMTAATPEARVALVKKFWDTRDGDELHSQGERLREHYKRLDYAQRNYRLITQNRHYDIVERYRPAVSEFDDRGVIYIRHGAPDQRATLSLSGLPPNETWSYRRSSGDLLFNFVAREGVQDYRLVESVLDILGYRNAVALEGAGNTQGGNVTGFTTRPVGAPPLTAAQNEVRLQTQQSNTLSNSAELLIRSRESLSPVYTHMLTSGKAGGSVSASEERAIGRHSIEVGTKSDSWALRYDKLLPARIDVLAVGSDSISPQLQVAFAIPGSALVVGKSVARGVTYLVRMRASVLALDGTVIATVDTIRGFVNSVPLGPRDQLLGRLPIHVPPGTFTVRVALETEGAGIVTERDTVRVASPLGPALGLSDLALGARSVHLPWKTIKGDTAWANPLHTFKASEPMQVYFEVTGLAPGTRYHYDVTVTKPGGGSPFKALGKLFGGGGSEMKLSFNQVTAGGADLVNRELGLEKLGPGKYVIEIAVSTAAGEKAVRTREFVVVK